jgi:hypothetical protein
MTEKKNQHYVPQFYLRHFSKAGNCIGLYNLKSSKIVAQASISGQASKNFFYGKDLIIENQLMKIEAITSRILNNILKQRRLPNRIEDDYRTLCLFMMIQESRTTQSVAKLNEMAEKLGKAILKRIVRDPAMLSYLPNLQISVTDPFILLLKQAIGTEPIIRDLKLKVIQNMSRVPFITSDHPVVFQNQFYDNVLDNRCRGLASEGLQILLPISSEYMLILYDNVVYKLGSIATNFIQVRSECEIEALNGHQWIGAMENVYFPEGADGALLVKSAEKFIALRKSDRVDLTITPMDENEFRARELIEISNGSSHIARLNICQPRIEKAAVSDGQFPLRNGEWVANVVEWERELKEGRLSFDEFWLLTAKTPTAGVGGRRRSKIIP